MSVDVPFFFLDPVERALGLLAADHIGLLAVPFHWSRISYCTQLSLSSSSEVHLGLEHHDILSTSIPNIHSLLSRSRLSSISGSRCPLPQSTTKTPQPHHTPAAGFRQRRTCDHCTNVLDVDVSLIVRRTSKQIMRGGAGKKKSPTPVRDRLKAKVEQRSRERQLQQQDGGDAQAGYSSRSFFGSTSILRCTQRVPCLSLFSSSW